MTDMASLFSFDIFYLIIELLSIVVVMLNTSKTEQIMLLEIPCQIFFFVNIFCLANKLCLIHPILIWSRLLDTLPNFLFTSSEAKRDH